ncbi:MAG TPA: CocE/NonD family hydrolase [Aeromicrobium sp.]|nr:CocE/NonD family hydrolase [Aeromicrobium sp.]
MTQITTNSPRGRRAVQLAASVLALLGMLLVAQPSATAATATPVAHGSVHQVWATDLPPGDDVELLDAVDTVVQTKTADDQGAVLFRDVAAGPGYRIRLADDTTSEPITVHELTPEPWDPSTYDQTIEPDGYGYLTTRDGTKLAYSVHLPTSPATLGVGLPEELSNLLPGLGLPYTPPYPTLIEYSGYATAKPDGPESGIAVIANLMGYAVVDVSMRGTGCSGGAFDFFETMQNLDAYDVIETVARQPWVKGNKVGMLGISYGGISQLFAAQYNPPSLAAIAPLSVIASVPTTLFPGGYLNTGFAYEWALDRVADARPASATTGQPYAWEQIQSGDTVCAENQKMHGQALDLLAKIEANQHYVPATADPLDPVAFVDKIKTPVFMACQWQDEQTGGYCPVLARHMTGTDKKWFTFTNGVHTDSLDPATLNHMFDFFQLYVAEEAPVVKSVLLRATAPLIIQQAFGLPQSEVMTLPPDPIQSKLTYQSALEAFEDLPRVTVRFDNGAGSATAGNPVAAYQHTYDALPIPAEQATTWYMGQGGVLTSSRPTATSITGYTSDADATPATNFTGSTGAGGLWGNASQWSWNWVQHPDSGAAGTENTAVSFITPELADDTTVVGSGAVYLNLRSSTPDVDLMATITEVRPDGNETYVQSGYVRASNRVLDHTADSHMKQASTELEPILSLRAEDAHAMPPGAFTPVAVPLYYQGHAYRAGSRIRVTISAPHGDQPIWAFASTEPGFPSQVAIATGPVGSPDRNHAMSRLVLPVIADQTIPTGYPACPSLRNQPCRPYQAIDNPVLPGDVTFVAAPGDPTTGPTTSAPGGSTDSPAEPTHDSLGAGSDLAADAMPSTGSSTTWASVLAALAAMVLGAQLWLAGRFGQR